MIHVAALLWITPYTSGVSKTYRPNNDIKVSLNPYVSEKSHHPSQSHLKNDQIFKPEKQKKEKARHKQGKSVELVKAALPRTPIKKPVSHQVLKAKPVEQHADLSTGISPQPTVQQPQAPAYDPQRLRIRIQELIHYRINHNQYYPRIARMRAWEGQVKLGMHVKSDGQLTNIHVVASSGHRVLDKAAMKSLSVVTNLPETIDWLQGRGIDVILPIIYKLTDS